jgi:hypothetical protein
MILTRRERDPNRKLANAMNEITTDVSDDVAYRIVTMKFQLETSGATFEQIRTTRTIIVEEDWRTPVCGCFGKIDEVATIEQVDGVELP